MADINTFDAIVSDSDFKILSPVEKRQVMDRFYNNVVRKDADFDPQEEPEIRNRYYSKVNEVLGGSPQRTMGVPEFRQQGSPQEGLPPQVNDSGKVIDVLKTPGVLPAAAGLAVAPFTGGLSLIPAAGALGLAGVAGELGRQNLAKEPADLESAAWQGAWNMLGEGAVRGGVAGLKVAANALRGPIRRAIAQGMSLMRGPKTSYESIARAFEGEGVESVLKEGAKELPEIRKTKEMTLIGKVMDEKAVAAVDDVQNAMESLRSKWGKAVERVDNVLAGRAKGIEVDISKTVSKIGNEYGEAIKDPAVEKMVASNSDFKKMGDVLYELLNNPKKSIPQLIQIRRQIGEVVNWKRMPVGEKVPDVVTKIYKDLYHEVSQKILNVAKSKKIKMYEPIYNKFSDIATTWDETLRKVYSSSEGELAQANVADKFLNYFNKSGYHSGVLGKTGKILGRDADKVERLLDITAARNLTSMSVGGPSSGMSGIIRKLMVNPSVIKAVKSGTNLGPVLERELPKYIATSAGQIGGVTAAELNK